jgi:glycosyltransferase involved in cell wall biosynthesis
MTVEVLLPVRAPAPWLVPALQSIAGQTLPPENVIICLHGSTDFQIEKALKGVRLPVRILQVPVSRNLSEVLNLGLGISTARYVARMDSDDICLPSRFEEQWSFLEANPNCAVLGTGADIIDENGCLVGQRPGLSQGQTRARLRWRNALIHSSVMMRRETVVSLGGYSPDAERAEDYELWLRVAANYHLESLARVLMFYRVHGGQVTKSNNMPALSRQAVGTSRVALAAAWGESKIAARLRHGAWAAHDQVRGRLL